jgi:phage recombination protein Bet
MDNSKVLVLPQQEAYNREQIELIKNTVAKGATDDELKMFTNIAQKYGLDPFIKEIWFIKRAKKVKGRDGNWDYPRLPNGEIDYRDAETLIMTSRDGYLKIAQRDPEFDGIIGFPVKEGDDFQIDAQNYHVTHKFGAKRGKIIGAWSKVDHKHRKPVIVYADFVEYNAPNSTTWKQYPSAMIQKVAEVLALKRQFGISGLVTREEMKDIDMTEDEAKVDEKVIDISPDMVQTQDTNDVNSDLEAIKEESLQTCEECDAIIEDYKGMTPVELIKYSQKHFGMKLCGDCTAKKLKEKKAAKDAVNE